MGVEPKVYDDDDMLLHKFLSRPLNQAIATNRAISHATPRLLNILASVIPSSIPSTIIRFSTFPLSPYMTPTLTATLPNVTAGPPLNYSVKTPLMRLSVRE